MFKVGDWVKSNFNGVISKVVENYNEEPYTVDISVLNNVMFELWEPKEGEWCWFWNKGATKPTIGQFENKHTKSTYNMKNSMYFYDYCEPFIGTLPSFLKN